MSYGRLDMGVPVIIIFFLDTFANLWKDFAVFDDGFFIWVDSSNITPTFLNSKNAYPFQKDAFDEIKDKDFFAIFHEQGLGKTKIAIDLAFYWLEKNHVDSVLICTKKNLIKNWEDELNFHGNVSPLILTSNKSTNSQKLGLPGSIYLCNYELIRDHIEIYETFFELRKVGVILDESTQIKNPSSKTPGVAMSIRTLSSFLKLEIIWFLSLVDNFPCIPTAPLMEK